MSYERIIRNQYFIEKKPIGRGSLSKVFKAFDRKKTIYVALKEIEIYDIEDEIEINRIYQEAITLSNLNHHNIIKYLDSFFENEKFYIISELCNQGSLEDAIIKPRIRTDELKVIKWLFQSVDALKYIHEKSIYHRDIKPLNIFLMQDNIKLGDFGISLTISGTIYALSLFGTELYRAPEILKKEKYDSKSDVWSLGVSFYELCCFKTPYKSEHDIAHNVSYDYLANYSIGLNEVINKMLLYDPVLRANVNEILKFIEKHFKNFNSVNNKEEIKLPFELTTSRCSTVVAKKNTFMVTNEQLKFGSFFSIITKNIHKIYYKVDKRRKEIIKRKMQSYLENTDLTDLFKNLDQEKIPDVFKNKESNKDVISKYKVFTTGILTYIYIHTGLGTEGLLADGIYTIIVWENINSHMDDEHLVSPGFFLFCDKFDFENCFEEIK